MNADELAAVVDELIEVLHLQARELERLVTHVEQVTVHLPEKSEIAAVRASLTVLHQRIKKLRNAS